MIKLASPHISDHAIEKVGEILRSGNLVQGEYVRAFETQLEEYLKIDHVVVVSSGTAALHLSMVALGIGPGDEVIVPAFTFPATANAVALVGAKPVFVDINLDDFCINPALIDAAITPMTKAIMPVHEFGQSADMDPILEIARKHELFVIEDAACALGTEFQGKKAGTLGDLGCFSFHPRKAITTGEGGVVATNDSGLARKISALRNHGMENNMRKIDFPYAGFNYRMTEFQAVLGIYQLRDLEKFIDQRTMQAKAYDDMFIEAEWISTPKIFPDRRHVYQTYHLIVERNYSRDNIIKTLKKKGIETNIGAYFVPATKYYSENSSFLGTLFKNSKQSFLNGIALPVGTHLSAMDIKKIANKLISCAE